MVLLTILVETLYLLQADHVSAMREAIKWGEEIPIGVIYPNERPPFEKHFSALRKGALVGQEVDRLKLKKSD